MTQERCQVCGGEGLFYASYGDQMDHKLTKCDCTALKESPEPDFVKPIAREQSFLPGICPHKHMVFCSCLCQAHDLIATAIRNALQKRQNAPRHSSKSPPGQCRCAADHRRPEG